MDNLINYKKLRSRAWQVIRDSQKSSWRAYISSLTQYTSSRYVWQKVKKIKECGTLVLSLVCLFMDPLKQLQKLLSRNWHLIVPVCLFLTITSPTFEITNQKEEMKVLDFSTASSDDYNLPFTLSELQSPLSCAHTTAPGPHQIHNLMLKNLPDPGCIFSSLSLSLQPNWA